MEDADVAGLGIPTAHAAAMGVAEVARGYDDEVVQPPDTQAAQRGAHEGAAAGLTDVEPMGAERTQKSGERCRHPTGFFGGIERDGDVVHALN